MGGIRILAPIRAYPAVHTRDLVLPLDRVGACEVGARKSVLSTDSFRSQKLHECEVEAELGFGAPD